MRFYLIGIKGSGMAALAELLAEDGYAVTGSDVTRYVFTEEALKERRIEILPLSDDSFLKDSFVIVGHDFMDEFLIQSLHQKRVPFMEYHKFLSFYLMRDHLISVCGSHGKTTLTGLLASAHQNASMLSGDGQARRAGDERYFFLESCEYQNHFLAYRPEFIIITNIDYDHIDFFPKEEDYIRAFRTFASHAPAGLVEYGSAQKLQNPYFLTFGIDERADFHVRDYRVDQKGIRGKFYFQSEYLTDFSFPDLFGFPLLMDVIAALAFYTLRHEDLETVKSGIARYRMAKKRFNISTVNGRILIEDYAHHPHQIAANYETVSRTYPGYKTIAVFRPDRLSRFHYFRKEFQRALSAFDAAYLLNFPDGKHTDLLREAQGTTLTYLPEEDLMMHLPQERCVILFMSSKNLKPLIKEVSEFYSHLDPPLIG